MAQSNKSKDAPQTDAALEPFLDCLADLLAESVKRELAESKPQPSFQEEK